MEAPVESNSTIWSALPPALRKVRSLPEVKNFDNFSRIIVICEDKGKIHTFEAPITYLGLGVNRQTTRLVTRDDVADLKLKFRVPQRVLVCFSYLGPEENKILIDSLIADDNKFKKLSNLLAVYRDAGTTDPRTYLRLLQEAITYLERKTLSIRDAPPKKVPNLQGVKYNPNYEEDQKKIKKTNEELDVDSRNLARKEFNQLRYRIYETGFLVGSEQIEDLFTFITEFALIFLDLEKSYTVQLSSMVVPITTEEEIEEKWRNRIKNRITRELHNANEPLSPKVVNPLVISTHKWLNGFKPRTDEDYFYIYLLAYSNKLKMNVPLSYADLDEFKDLFNTKRNRIQFSGDSALDIFHEYRQFRRKYTDWKNNQLDLEKQNLKRDNLNRVSQTGTRIYESLLLIRYCLYCGPSTKENRNRWLAITDVLGAAANSLEYCSFVNYFDFMNNDPLNKLNTLSYDNIIKDAHEEFMSPQVQKKEKKARDQREYRGIISTAVELLMKHEIRNVLITDSRIEDDVPYILPLNVVKDILRGQKGKFFESADYYTSGLLSKLDLSRSYVTGSIIPACVGSERVPPRDLIDLLYPTVYTVPESYERYREILFSGEPLVITDTSISNTTKTVRLERVTGADIDIAIDTDDDEEFKEIVGKHMDVLKKLYSDIKVKIIPRKSGETWEISGGPRIIQIFKSNIHKILLHHVAMVRGYITGNGEDRQCYLSATAVSSFSRNRSINYYYFGGKSTPMEIILKYYQRGFEINTSVDIDRIIDKYVDQNPKWQYPHLKTISPKYTEKRVRGLSAAATGYGNFNATKHNIELSRDILAYNLANQKSDEMKERGYNLNTNNENKLLSIFGLARAEKSPQASPSPSPRRSPSPRSRSPSPRRVIDDSDDDE